MSCIDLGPIHYKTQSYLYRDSPYIPVAVIRPSQVYNGIPIPTRRRLLVNRSPWVNFLFLAPGHLRIVSVSESRCYIYNVYSHWLKTLSYDMR